MESKEITAAFETIFSYWTNIHSPTKCGAVCVVHRRTEHSMSEFVPFWRVDRGFLIERICPHGVGHPEPDQMKFYEITGRDYMGVHGCDGCCE